jgi:hypothetical protein
MKEDWEFMVKLVYLFIIFWFRLRNFILFYFNIFNKIIGQNVLTPPKKMHPFVKFLHSLFEGF